jgi:hypothetical protein
MLKKRGVLSGLCVLMIFCFALVMGCAQPPKEEMAKADKAVADAKAKEADVYAAEAFKKAEDALKKAKDQVAAKKYKEAKQAAIDAASLASQAVAGVEAGKAKMKEDAAKLAEDVVKALDELKIDVAVALKKKLAIQKEELQAAIGKWSVDLAMAKDKLQGEKISEAMGEINEMTAAIGAKKEEIAKMIADAPAAPEKKEQEVRRLYDYPVTSAGRAPHPSPLTPETAKHTPSPPELPFAEPMLRESPGMGGFGKSPVRRRLTRRHVFNRA